MLDRFLAPRTEAAYAAMRIVAGFLFAFGASFFPRINEGELAAVYAFVFLYITCKGAGVASIEGMLKPRGGTPA